MSGSGTRLAVAALAAVAAWGHIGYPLWLAFVTRGRGRGAPPVGAAPRSVSVIVPAYREPGVIAEKVHDLRANGYGGPLEIAVVADDPGTAAVVPDGASVIRAEHRSGKADALNRGVAATKGEIIVVTDANTRLAPGALRALVRWFADESVGAVAGEKRVVGPAGTGFYWAFESWLKSRESRTGTTIGLVGELAAVRRSLYRAIPSDVPADDLWLALDVVEQGARVVYDPEALALEEASPTWRAEWERRTRVTAAILDVLWRRRMLLAPARGTVAAQLWGHRLVRSSIGPVAHALLLLIAVRSAGRSRPALAVAAGHVFAFAAFLRQARGARVTALESLAAQVLFLQATGFAGLIRFLRGDRSPFWPKDER